MDKKITITVDEDVYEKFSLAMNLRKDKENYAIETCMRWYSGKTLQKTPQDYNLNKSVNESDSYYGKAIQRIPNWASEPTQYNHKIISAYFKAVAITGRATVDTMKLICSDKNIPELYVPTFRSNYSEMKFDGPKSHGKVFEDDGEKVWIWNEVEEMLMKYKTSFYSDEL